MPLALLRCCQVLDVSITIVTTNHLKSGSDSRIVAFGRCGKYKILLEVRAATLALHQLKE